MRRNGLFPPFLVGLLILISIPCGCGKKGDPLPPRMTSSAAIDEVNITVQSEGILIDWSLNGAAGGIGSFAIYRSVVAEGVQVCPGCPRQYRPLETFPIADSRLQRIEDRKFRYLDRDVIVGRLYSYRLSVCDGRGNCGDASHESSVVMFGR